MDMETISKLKIIVKHLSDQVAYSVPIPIKWLKLASDILKQPILDNSSIHYLAENSQCSEDLPRILEYFHEIGLFFYKQGILIIDIQILLDLIYHIIFPPFDHKQVDIDTEKLKISKKDIQHFMDEGKLYLNLFEYIVGEYLNLRSVREPLLELLQLFGILIKCKPKCCVLTSFHVPYLQLYSLDNLLQHFPKKILCSRYIINFLDDFQSTSLYFTILSECSKRNEAYQLSSSKIGFDCAIFYISDSLTVSFDFLTILNNILLSFFLYESALYQDEYVNSEILNYLTFLQFTLVKIQNTLIPCGSLAKVIALCDTCSTLSSLQLEEKPICTLDTLFLTISNVYSICFDQSDAEDLQTINIQNISDNLPWIKGRFCCESQFERVFKCFYRKDPLFVVIYNSYYNSDLEDFIKKNHEVFARYLNWNKLARLLYIHGLITIERYSTIIYSVAARDELSKKYLFDMFHKVPLWAYKFYFTLRFDTTEPKHRYLCDFIDTQVKKGVGTQPVYKLQILSDQIYLMNKRPHGIAFIVNIEKFREGSDYEPRTGSKCDVDSLKSVFNYLHYQTEILENLTRKDFLRNLKDIRGRRHSQYDSFICVIMLHGNKNGQIISSDDKPLSKIKLWGNSHPDTVMISKKSQRYFSFKLAGVLR